MPRSKPFSGKQKKQQLKEKKKKKNESNLWNDENEHGDQARTNEAALGRRPQHQRRAEPKRNPRNRSRSTDREEDDEKIGRILSNSDEDEAALELDPNNSGDNLDPEDEEEELEEGSETGEEEVRSARPGRKTNRPDLRTVFDLETTEEILQRKQEARLPLDLSRRERPWAVLREEEDSFLQEVGYIPMPKRPRWSFDTPKQVVLQKEKEIFHNWLNHLKTTYPPERLNYFERNLEVWRQLWRVSERSDAVMLITDARYPLFHFPPALYNYLVEDLQKPIILVLNKIDLVDPASLLLWEDYFRAHYPDIKAIIKFNSFSQGARSETSDQDELKRKKKRGRRRYEDAKGVEELFAAIRSLGIRNKITNELIEVPNRQLLRQQAEDEPKKKSRRRKAKAASRSRSRGRTDDDDEGEEDDSSDEKQSEDQVSGTDTEDEGEEERRRNAGVITIGTVGHPNVGKSSLINGLVGKKVVSTSRTPGHTKHFQTIRLTPEIQLCDCPGLVFPALDRPKALQILCGLFPLAQVREPFSAIRYLAERVAVEKVYGLELDEDEKEWSPWNLCEAFATKKQYFIARSGRPDVHRAGLEILRDCLDGLIVISWPPPDTTEEMLRKAQETAKKQKEIAKNQWKMAQQDFDETDEEVAEEEEGEDEGEGEGEEAGLETSDLNETTAPQEQKEGEEEEDTSSKREKTSNRTKKQRKTKRHALGTAQSLVDSSEEVSYGNAKFADRDLLLLANMKNASRGLQDHRGKQVQKQKLSHNASVSSGDASSSSSGPSRAGKKGGNSNTKALEYQQRLAEKQSKEQSLRALARTKKTR